MTRRHDGFTLTELMVGLAISMIVLATIYSSVMALTRGSQSLINYTEMNAASRVILEQFARDARMGTEVSRSDSSRFKLVTNGLNVEYRYISGTTSSGAPNGVLQRSADDGATWDTLISNIERFDFTYFNLLGTETTNPLSVKQVQIEATVRRKVLTADNTNHIISARFMLRNRRVAN